MTNRIFYLMSGSAHLPYLLVSLFTLRKHYNGSVTVYAWPESYDIAKKICNDPLLDAYCVKREPEYRGKNCQFIDKIKIAMQEQADAVLYLDADTSIHGKIDNLFLPFENTRNHSFVATQWNDWVTSGRGISKRIEDLREFTDRMVIARLIDELQEKPYPSVNGGVWSCRPSSPVLRKWSDYTWIARSKFIADEKALHLMMPLFMIGEEVKNCEMIVLGPNGIYNSSPKLQSKQLDDKDLVVMHYHGDSNVRPEKSQRGFDLWWPLWQRCLNGNIGSVNSWKNDVHNKWMKKLEQDGVVKI